MEECYSEYIEEYLNEMEADFRQDDSGNLFRVITHPICISVKKETDDYYYAYVGDGAKEDNFLMRVNDWGHLSTLVQILDYGDYTPPSIANKVIDYFKNV